MSKKHFVLLANSLAQTRPERLTLTSKTTESEAWEQWVRTTQEIADVLRRTNERFDRTKFLVACGCPL